MLLAVNTQELPENIWKHLRTNHSEMRAEGNHAGPVFGMAMQKYFVL